jgi:hypothetical protein
MQESHRKGVANHPDPESCVAYRKVRREALTGAHAGWVLSFVISVLERRRCHGKRKATRTGAITQGPGRLHGVGDPKHAWKLNAREPGGPGGARSLEKAAGRKGNPQGHALRARRREVGPLRSTGEGSEQAPQGVRRGWREGDGSRRTTWRNARPRRRSGYPCSSESMGCGKPRQCGFPPSIRDKSRVR